MKSVKYFKDWFNSKVVKRIDQKILIYLIFVGIATIFWFLNKLGNEFTATIHYPVKYIDVPENKLIISDLPEELELELSGRGYTLLKYKFKIISFPIAISISDYIEKQGASAKTKELKIHPRIIKANINKQLNKNINIIDILPQTINCSFADIIEKKVAIAPNIDIQFAPQCMLDGKIKFTPDSVMVRGSEQILDTMRYVYTKPMKVKNLDKNFERNVSIKSIKNVSIDNKRTVMLVKVDKYTENTLKIPISAINVPKERRLITFPQKVKIKYLVSFDECNRISEQDFRLQVNYNDIENLLGNKLTVRLSKHPKNIKNISFTPKFVEYIIEQK